MHRLFRVIVNDANYYNVSGEAVTVVLALAVVRRVHRTDAAWAGDDQYTKVLSRIMSCHLMTIIAA